MKEITNSETQNNKSNKKTTLMEALKESRKIQNKSMKSPNPLIINDNNYLEKDLHNNNIYNKQNEGMTFEKFKEDKNNFNVQIKKIKIINKEDKNNKNELPQITSSNLRKIYVDLNDTEYINEETSIILSSQKASFNSNSIRTCQYTIITFLPLALFNQFKTAFNWFFLIYNIIAVIPELSDLDPLAEISPFIVVLLLNLVKEAIEDYRKYKNDIKANNASVLIFNDKRFIKDKCKNIRVGNIIKIYKEDLIPADVLIIKSSLKNGLAYMQTSNLDGENTLKPREALHLTQKCNLNSLKNFKNLFDCNKDHFYIEVIHPNKNIYDIEGTAFFDNNKNHINIKNVLLRGSRLKNVDYVYGIVIYNGHDTKLMQNIEHSSTKLSTIDVKLNYIIFIIFIIFLIMNTISSCVGINSREEKLPNYDKNQTRAEYLFYYNKTDPKNALEITRIISNNFLIYNTLIPVSIFIAFTFCKIWQTIYLQEYSPEYRKDPNDNIKCYNTGLMDELGLVKYIFSDKTGTLTKNEMIFKGCSIYRELFDDNDNNNGSMASDTYIAQNMFNIPPQSKFGSSPSKINLSCNLSTKGWTNQSKLTVSKVSDSFSQTNLFKYLHNRVSTSTTIGGIPFSNKYEPFEKFFTNIIVNHDVLIEENSNNEIHFQGASPDEITLVTAAYEFGYCFKSRKEGYITIEIIEQEPRYKAREKKFKILEKFDFTSERQCSSIVVEDETTKIITLYIKGSDKKIFNIIDDYSKSNILSKTKEHLDNFAKQGLRTLCFAFKNISKYDFNQWQNKYKIAQHKSLENKIYEKDLNKLINALESNVTLLGVTALEDKLQDEVEKDIKKFIDAGINFWMITGDKMDTAESIGYSCGIFSEDSDVYKIRETNDVKKVIKEMKEISEKIDKIDSELNSITKKHHEDMIENKIIKNDEKYRKYRRRYNSFNAVEGTENFDIILMNKKKKENNNVEVFKNDIIEIKESEEIMQNAKTRITNNNENNNANDIKIKEDKFESDEISLKHNKNNISMNDKKIQYTNDIDKLTNNSKDSKNDKIFKFVVKNADNISNMNDYSLIQKKIQKVSDSINSSEIFYEDKDSPKNEINSKDKLFEAEQKDDNKSIKEEKKQKDIPLEEKRFKSYFDFCQNELYKMAIQQSNRLKLFKIKYLYPIPQDSSYIYKKITSKFSLILEGQSINTCMEKGEAADLFWSLIQRSKSLICCRASPSQKSQIVDFVKKRTDSVTLGIGDGGNDVNMIRAANVGIGIFGKEGYQAAYNSDFAISQFKYLKGLLFKEGRLTLSKNCYFLYHYFFKNFLFTISLFWFGAFSLFSGINYYDDYYTFAFNTFLTVILICITAILDEEFDYKFSSYDDKERQILFTFLPNIYKEYRDSIPFNLIKFFTIFFISYIFSFICYFIPAYVFKNNFYGMGLYGYQYSFWDCSIITYLSIVSIHYFIMLIDNNCYNSGIIIFYCIQIVITFLILVSYNSAINLEIYGNLGYIIKNWHCWLTYIITCGICLMLFYILRMGEYFFGGFIINKIKQKQFDIFIEKFYQKKVEQMTRVVRNVAKFKRIYYNINDDKQEEDNLNYRKMKIYVDEFKDKQIKYKNLNLKKNKSSLK